MASSKACVSEYVIQLGCTFSHNHNQVGLAECYFPSLCHEGKISASPEWEQNLSKVKQANTGNDRVFFILGPNAQAVRLLLDFHYIMNFLQYETFDRCPLRITQTTGQIVELSVDHPPRAPSTLRGSRRRFL